MLVTAEPDPRVVEPWHRYGQVIAIPAIAYLVIAAAGRLWYALPRLVMDLESWSALDLKYRHNEVIQWFAGQPVYGVVDGAVYPPASHLILWPLLGWLSLGSARVLWAATTLVGAAILAVIVYRTCTGRTRRDRLLFAGLAFAGYPLQMALFVGQMGVHVAAFAALGALLLFRRTPALATDSVAALLLSASLVKPTLSAPLVAAALIACGRARPALLTMTAYGSLTLAAAAVQPAGLFELLRDWLAIASVRVPVLEGVPNVQMLLARFGLYSWMSPASIILLAGMIVWMWPRRNADPWLLLGIAAIVARFWAHSALYDDALMLLAVIALARTAFTGTDRYRPVAGWLLVAAWVALLTPTWAFYDLGSGAAWTIHLGQASLWLAALVLLAVAAREASTGNTIDQAPLLHHS